MLTRYAQFLRKLFFFLLSFVLYSLVFFGSALGPLFLKGWVTGSAGANALLFSSFVSMPVAFLALGDVQGRFRLHFYLIGIGILLGVYLYWSANLNPVKDLANSIFSAWAMVYLLAFLFRFFTNKNSHSSMCHSRGRVE